MGRFSFETSSNATVVGRYGVGGAAGGSWEGDFGSEGAVANMTLPGKSKSGVFSIKILYSSFTVHVPKVAASE